MQTKRLQVVNNRIKVSDIPYFVSTKAGNRDYSFDLETVLAAIILELVIAYAGYSTSLTWIVALSTEVLTQKDQ